MPPVCSQRTPCFAEQLLPIHVARLHAGGGGVAAVVERDGRPLRVADFGEVEADAVDLADAVVLARDGVRDVHADGAGVVGDDAGPSATC